MRIAGNLDVEVTWARMHATARRARGETAPSPDDPRFALPEPVMRKISAAATLMRVAALDDEDELWTPRPVDPARMARVDWLPSPRVFSGPRPATADVWFGEPTEVAARVNHRSFVHELRKSLRCDAEGEVLVRDADDLARRTATMGEWVAKAAHSSAGRLKVRGTARATGAALAQAVSLLELYGAVLLEPWLPRRADFGVVGEVTADGWDAADAHRLLTDDAGRFRGIRLPGGAAPEAERAMQAIVAAFAETLQSAGYRGAFGVDFVEIATCDASVHRVHAAEINARHTFGHVAQALAPKARAPMGIGEADPLTLRFGRGVPPPATLPLLLPGSDDDTSAWLECPDRHGS